ncbi:MAG TPA: phosphodiesterase [Polyangiaceae bacterium]
MPVRVVQLTDLHLKARPGDKSRGVDVWAALRAVLDQVSVHNPACLIVTGDLAADPRTTTYRSLKDLLGSWTDVQVLPGNHDDREAVRVVFGLGPKPSIGFALNVAGWRLIGLDTTRPGRVHGQIDAQQMTWLESELDRCPEPVMLFMHHPPFRIGTWWLDKDLIRGVKSLEQVLDRSGRVRAIFCGHVHQESQGCFADAEVFTTPSTAYQFRPGAWLPARLGDELPGFRVIDLDPGAFETRVIRVGGEAVV